jgi:hypothetical protein
LFSFFIAEADDLFLEYFGLLLNEPLSSTHSGRSNTQAEKEKVILFHFCLIFSGEREVVDKSIIDDVDGEPVLDFEAEKVKRVREFKTLGGKRRCWVRKNSKQRTS